MKVLSVDDKPENLYMLEALLRGHGHEVDSASNGQAALNLAERGGYDLIISDILMPRMDGFQLCRELKKDARLSRIPFVFYTATYTDPRDATFALSLGADRFLIKPLEPAAFMKAVAEVIAKTTAADGDGAAIVGEDEAIYLKEYNARLVSKLEKKMLDLEAANRALVEDIAERERAALERAGFEERLRQAQKLEAIGTLAGGIAHDFNNILAGVIGFADLGVREAADPQAAEQHFREILRAGERARNLVRQILAFSRHREQDRRPLHLDETIKEALRLLRAALPASIQLAVTLEPKTPRVLADSTQLHQIVTNLVTNAGHAIGERSGVISIYLGGFLADENSVSANPELRAGRYVRLTVQDDGAGMTPEIVARIFEPFFTTKAPGEGTGLGLSVVHGLMKSLDGAITVESEVGRGTTFQLYFPALEFGDLVAPPPVGTETRGTGERVLFVDDEPVLAALGERFLTRLGYVPVIETDPRAALARFAETPFDLVITDLTMPHLSGAELARKLWEIRPQTRIVLTTGYSATLDAQRASEQGFLALLLKPYTVHALSEVLRNAFKT